MEPIFIIVLCITLTLLMFLALSAYSVLKAEPEDRKLDIKLFIFILCLTIISGLSLIHIFNLLVEQNILK
jgi:hypothetical protein